MAGETGIQRPVGGGFRPDRRTRLPGDRAGHGFHDYPAAADRQSLCPAEAREVVEEAAPLTYVVWALLFVHLGLLEGLGVQHGTDGSGHPRRRPYFHQRFYQLLYCSIFLFVLRLPPVKRWIGRKHEGARDGRNGPLSCHSSCSLPSGFLSWPTRRSSRASRLYATRQQRMTR